MTIRERIADWLTGGRYSGYLDQSRMWHDLYINDGDKINNLEFDLAVYKETHKDLTAKLVARDAALSEIASIPVTASSNGQTRKAVRIAKEGLK